MISIQLLYIDILYWIKRTFYDLYGFSSVEIYDLHYLINKSPFFRF